MKYKFALVVIVFAGCNSLLGSDDSQSLASSPLHYKSKYVIQAGTFVGTWEGDSANYNFQNFNSCTLTIHEADSVLNGTVINDSTDEIIHLSGVRGPDRIGDWHALSYTVTGTSNKKFSYSFIQFDFSKSGDTIICSAARVLQNDSLQGYGIWLFCIRQPVAVTRK